MTRQLVIIGCGGFGREVFCLVTALAHRSAWGVEGFVDDGPRPEDVDRVLALGSRVLSTVGALSERRQAFATVIAIGDPGVRQAVASRLERAPATFPALIHPDATLGAAVRMGPGVVVAAGARLSTNITLGRHVHVDQNVTVGHDSHIDNFARLNPQACISGGVQVGERALVGASATVLPGVVVGPNSVVGAAACVVHDVPAGAVVKGVPAR